MTKMKNESSLSPLSQVMKLVRFILNLFLCYKIRKIEKLIFSSR